MAEQPKAEQELRRLLWEHMVIANEPDEPRDTMPDQGSRNAGTLEHLARRIQQIGEGMAPDRYAAIYREVEAQVKKSAAEARSAELRGR